MKQEPSRVPAQSTFRRVVERILTFVAGLQFAAIGFGFAALAAWNIQSFALITLVTVLPLVFIGLFGANMVVQAVRGKSRHEGFFYVLLAKLAAFGPRTVTIGLPVFLCVALLQALATGNSEALETGLTFAAFWVGIVGSTFVHEMGHAVAAVSMGLPVDRMVFGPLEVVSTPEGYRWGLSNHWLAVAGGFVLVQTSDLPDPRRILTFALGGPVATLALLLVTLQLNPYDYLQVVKANSPGAALVLYTLFATSIALVFNMLPLRDSMYGFHSDGYLIRESLSAIRSQR